MDSLTDAAEDALLCLEHLVRYFTVLELENPDPASRLAGKLEVKLLHTPDELLDMPGGIATVRHMDDIYYLHIRNLHAPLDRPPSDDREYLQETAKRTLTITVLNLTPDWGIAQLIPDGGTPYELGPGEVLRIPDEANPGGLPVLPSYRSAVPDGDREEAIDIFKIFATTETSDYRSFLLDPVKDVVRSRATPASPPKPQEPERSWITTQLLIRVVRDDTTT